MYETQKESRVRKLKEGWKRVEAFLDPETAKLWEGRVDEYGGPTALVKLGLEKIVAAEKRRTVTRRGSQKPR